MKSTSKFNYSVIAVIIIAVLSAFNILYFISLAANPIIKSDAWYFLDTVIRKWYESGFEITDLFIKRTLSDHAQPLNKLFLMFNYYFLGLDFKYEALVGFFALLGIIILFVVQYVRKINGANSNIFSSILFISGILIITSLNSTEIYTWPLVTFGILTQFMAFFIAIVTWRFLIKKSTIVEILISMLFLFLMGDTAAILLWVSLLATVSIFLLNGNKSDRIRAAKWVVASFTFVIAYFFIVNYNFIFGGHNQLATQGQSQVNWFNLNTYLDAIRIVFSSSLIHKTHMRLLGSYATPLSWIVAVIVVGFYIRYFVVLLRKKQNFTTIKFLTTMILIYATFQILAILFGRITIFGIDYFNQLRYVKAYQLIPFALFMDYAFYLTNRNVNVKLYKKVAIISVGTILLFMQFLYVIKSYRAVNWISKYHTSQAKAIGNYTIDPMMSTGETITSPFCNYSPKKRRELLHILETKKLNLFNPSFQWKYRFFPFDMTSQNSYPIKIVNWGPQTINLSHNHNIVGVWIKLEQGLIDYRRKLIIKIDSVSIEPVIDGNVVSFSIPKKILSKPDKHTIKLIDKTFSSETVVGILNLQGAT